jgi:hypothetical protein
MKDFLGVEMLLGDTVVSYDPEYKSLAWFVVEKFTPKMVRIRVAGGKKTTIRLAGECVIVLEKRKVTV